MKPINGTTTVDALRELTSAQSALNMVPEPIENPEGIYLTDKDRWVKHAEEHMGMAIAILAGVINKELVYER